MKRVAFGACVALAVLAGCGEPEQMMSPRATVTFVYKAATERNLAVPDCGVGKTHIHPSWSNFEKVDLRANGPMEWDFTFSNVPVGVLHRIRVSDANYCDRDLNGATTENVFANGVRLTSVVLTPGNGPEPGLSFLVLEDGTVKP
ncbi:MAG TPA: hypothetical protein VK447_06540 [Myxococcaceae bacterium]|nr:hypothetical protein [Myxococcaceae bacterium]